MNIAILGASGLVGSHLFYAARNAGHNVMGTCRNFPLPELTRLDLRDVKAATSALAAFQPEALFYCAGWTWVDGCEKDPERAFMENRDLPLTYCRLARDFGAHFTYLSSSYVFDGENGPYGEEALPRPISVYGKSKIEGERGLLETGWERLVIARTHGVYGKEPQEKNFVYQVVKKLQAGEVMRVPNDQFGNATYAGDMACQLLALMEQGQAGIWNLAGPEPMLRRDKFAIQIALAFNLPQSLIEPVPSLELKQVAPRPRFAGLLVDKGIGFFKEPPKSFSQALLHWDQHSSGTAPLSLIKPDGSINKWK